MRGIMFSGKRHCPTVKYQVTTAIADGFIVHITPGLAGTQHDQNLLQASGVLDLLVPGEKLVVDRGYVTGDLATQSKTIVGIVGPIPGSPEEAWNKLVASVRIQVERVLSYIKNFQVFQHTMIKDLAVHSMMFHLACHLTNWRITRYPSRKAPHPNIFNSFQQKP